MLFNIQTLTIKPFNFLNVTPLAIIETHNNHCLIKTQLRT